MTAAPVQEQSSEVQDLAISTSVTLYADQIEAIDRIGKPRRMKRAAIIRAAVDEYVAKHDPASDSTT